MGSESAYVRRRTRLQRVFGTGDTAAVAMVLRERRAALLGTLLHRALAGSLLIGIAVWRQRLRLRGALVRLRETSPHLLDDIGLDAAAADRETIRRVWQPQHVARPAAPRTGSPFPPKAPGAGTSS